MQLHDYDSLKDEYPEYLTAEQVCQICKIAKRTAAYLLQNGIIPCTDSGKKTRRYTIKLDDVIEYLKKRDVVGTMVPRGAVNSNYKPPMKHRECFASIIGCEDKEDLRDYFVFRSAEYPDVLRMSDVAELTGLRKNTVQRYLQKKVIKSIANAPVYLIPKAFLLEYVTSRHYIETTSNAESFHQVLGGFRSWKAAK